MPRLTKYAMRTGTLMLWCVVMLPCAAQVAVPRFESPNLAVRATGPLSDESLRRFAALVSARTLPERSYPDIKLLTARQVITVLCGSYRQAYHEQFMELNNGLSIPRSPDTVLGSTAYAAKWPGCPVVVERPNVRYTVKEGDTASDIFQTLTGATGSRRAVEQYFKASSVRDLSKITPGQKLVPAHISLPTMVHASLDARDFKSEFAFTASSAQQALGGNASSIVKVSALDPAIFEAPVVQTPATPKFEIAAGRIESTATSDIYESPEECRRTTSSNALFDAGKLAKAYADARKALPMLRLDTPSVRVTVADNGFFGARLQSGVVKFGPAFPERFFSTFATQGDGQIGPVVRKGNSEPVYPLNYSNKRNKATYVSGHGTHVTGLVIGGPDFQPFLSAFDRAPDAPWLRLWIVNIGDGEEFLLPNSVTELSYQINLLKDNIVNLSIQYTSPMAMTDSSVLRLVDAQTNNLFVVAAGNNGSSDVTDAPYYPAMLGGVSQRNVITVAAHRSDGGLAKFSNRGRLNVDFAAPGCDLASWLDDSSTVTRVSGTSQAAGFATFQATLLKSLGGLEPIDIKNRMMISGDVLLHRPAGTPKTATSDDDFPDPAQVYSRTRLNIVRSMFVFDDYVRYRDDNGIMREALGVVQGIQGLRCVDAVQWLNIWAVKASDDGLLVYKGRRSPKEVAQSPCEATASAGAMLMLKVRAELDASGELIPPSTSPALLLRVPISALDQFVAASRPYRQPL